MLSKISGGKRWTGAAVLLGAVFLGLSGCAHQAPPAASAPAPAPATAPAQLLFDTDQQAADALVAAARTQDKPALHQILGPSLSDFTSGDPVEDANAFKAFSAKAAERMRLEKLNPTTAQLYLGNQDWPFPIPLRQRPDGKWYFDTEAGKAAVLARRIGANELEAIDVCRAYVQAQREYASEDRDGSGLLQYAQRIVSHPGKKDGLYWPAEAGQAQSPFGPLVAQATEEGYAEGKIAGRHAFHGYHFRVLKRQGPDTPGGRYDYVINGHMIAGFALVAWPARYGSSGIMTFIVNHQGKVYQKDLGPRTAEIVHGMTEYNPDSSWTLVKD